MLERIRTFFGTTKGIHQDKTTVVAQGTAWYCTKCRLVFMTKEAGEQHKCLEQNVK
jgi:hypothetical protein